MLPNLMFSAYTSDHTKTKDWDVVWPYTTNELRNTERAELYRPPYIDGGGREEAENTVCGLSDASTVSHQYGESRLPFFAGADSPTMSHVGCSSDNSSDGRGEKPKGSDGVGADDVQALTTEGAGVDPLQNSSLLSLTVLLMKALAGEAEEPLPEVGDTSASSGVQKDQVTPKCSSLRHGRSDWKASNSLDNVTSINSDHLVWMQRSPYGVKDDRIVRILEQKLCRGQIVRVIGWSAPTSQGVWLYVLLDSEIAGQELSSSTPMSEGRLLTIPGCDNLGLIEVATHSVIDGMQGRKVHVHSKLSPSQMMEAYLRGTLCLGCDSVDHPLTKCPNATFVCPNCHHNDHRGGECVVSCRFCWRLHSGVNITRCIKNASREVKRLLEHHESWDEGHFGDQWSEQHLVKSEGSTRPPLVAMGSRPDDSFGRSVWIYPISDDISCEAIEKAINSECATGAVKSITRRPHQKWASVEMDSLRAAHDVVYTDLTVDGRSLKVQFKKVRKGTNGNNTDTCSPSPKSSVPEMGNEDAKVSENNADLPGGRGALLPGSDPMRSIMSLQCESGVLSTISDDELCRLENQLMSYLDSCLRCQDLCFQWIIAGRKERRDRAHYRLFDSDGPCI